MWTRRWCTSVLLIQRSVVWLEVGTAKVHHLLCPVRAKVCHYGFLQRNDLMAWYCLQSSISITEKIFCSRSPLPIHCKCHSAVRHQLHQCSHKTGIISLNNAEWDFQTFHEWSLYIIVFPHMWLLGWRKRRSISVDVSDHFVFPILSVQVVYSHESAATRLDKSHWTRRMEFPTIPQTLLLYHSFRGRLASTKELSSLLMSLLQVALPLHNDPLGESAKPNSIEFDQPGKSFA